MSGSVSNASKVVEADSSQVSPDSPEILSTPFARFLDSASIELPAHETYIDVFTVFLIILLTLPESELRGQRLRFEQEKAQNYHQHGAEKGGGKVALLPDL